MKKQAPAVVAPVPAPVPEAKDTGVDIGEGPEDKPEEEPILEDDEDKESFGSKLEYMLTLVGYAVGFGNIWRFPYLVQENGGIVFLVPYAISLFLIGIPTFYLEIAIGQRLRKGPIGCWNEISPYLGGIGIATGTICFIVAMYYNTLLSWAISYLFDSFRSELLYQDCTYATRTSNHSTNCTTNPTDKECRLCDIAGSSQYYWFNRVLIASDSIENSGQFNWWIAIMLFISWAIVWVILFKGLKAAGKVVYFTALFPYVVLLIFFINGLTLPGMGNGYKHLFTPQWERLADGKIWQTAASQIFFSLGLGFGCLVAFASYLKPNNNCYQDAMNISFINCATSVFAAMTMFPYLGSLGTNKYWECKRDRIVEFGDQTNLWPLIEFKTELTRSAFENLYDFSNDKTTEFLTLAYKRLGLSDTSSTSELEYYSFDGGPRYSTGLNLSETLPQCDLKSFIKAGAGGTGFVFIVMAKAISTLPCPPFWAFLFFGMLITLGIDSAFGTVEGAIAAVMDLKIPKLKRWHVTSVICGVLWMFSWLFAMGWAAYLQVFLDEFCANWGLLLVAFFESIGIAWIYGLPKFSKDLSLMTGVKPSFYFLVCWKYITPLLILIMLIYSLVETFVNSLKYSRWDREHSKSVPTDFPGYILAVGFLITITSMIGIPIVAFLHFIGRDVLDPEIPVHFPEKQLMMERRFEEGDFEATSLADKMMHLGSKPVTSLAAENASLTNTSGSKKDE